jgi:hypothetical protein
MADNPTRENGERGWRPVVPTTVVVIAILIALVAVSGLIYLLFQETVGPGQVLRDFSRRVEVQDCPGSFQLLDPEIADRIGESEWCNALPALSQHINPGFDIERVVLEGELARIDLDGEGVTPASWFLSRDGRSWLVRGVEGDVEFPGGALG